MIERMYDRLCFRGVMPEVFKILLRKDIPAIVIDNVAEWFYRGMLEEETWWDETSDFAHVGAPFGLMWMEYKTPRLVKDVTREDDPDAAEFDGVGFLIETYHVNQFPGVPFGAQELTFAAMSGMDTEYVTRVHIFLEGGMVQAEGPLHMWTWLYPYTKDGRIVPDTVRTGGKGILIGASSACTTMTKEDAEAAKPSFKSLLFSPMFAITFLHSPLVEIEEIKDVIKATAPKKNRHRAPKATETYFRLDFDKLLEEIAKHGSGKAALRAAKDHFRQNVNQGTTDEDV